jgi:hypothetical protein
MIFKIPMPIAARKIRCVGAASTLNPNVGVDGPVSKFHFPHEKRETSSSQQSYQSPLLFCL